MIGISSMVEMFRILVTGASSPQFSIPHSFKSTLSFKMRLAFVHTVNCFFVLINAFPFIEKSAVIGRSEVLKLQRELEYQAEEKRLLFDSLTTPIEGMA